MNSTIYTYQDAILLIKSKIANLTQQGKLKHGDLREFCLANNLEYYTVLNCLNSKTELYPNLIKTLLVIVLDIDNVVHKKQNLYFVEEI